MDALSLAIKKKNVYWKAKIVWKLIQLHITVRTGPNNDNNNPGPSAATAAGQITIDASRLNMLEQRLQTTIFARMFCAYKLREFSAHERPPIWISNHFYANVKAYRI